MTSRRRVVVGVAGLDGLLCMRRGEAPRFVAISFRFSVSWFISTYIKYVLCVYTASQYTSCCSHTFLNTHYTGTGHCTSILLLRKLREIISLPSAMFLCHVHYLNFLS